jgi:hypothetical protein
MGMNPKNQYIQLKDSLTPGKLEKATTQRLSITVMLVESLALGTA